jgi:colanic acid biosynthesis glycosyl transferase WcaI
MRILILSQYFWPEEFLINDFAKSLRDRGHYVEVLTGLPNYPSGKLYPGYSFSGPYRDAYNGIQIWRSPIFPRGNASGWRLIINYFSFAFLASIRGFLACWRSFDVILVYEVSPITVGIPARVIKALTGAKLFFWVQDLWPESLSATGVIHSDYILKCFGELTRWIYKGCDLILIQSRAFIESVLKYGVENKKIRYFPNCAEDYFRPVNPRKCTSESALMLPGFRVMFAGNIGKSQDFETLLSAAELTLGKPSIQWIILGDGRHRSWVEHEIYNRELNNVHLLGRHPKERMPAFFSLADVLLIALKRKPLFALTVPSKVQAYLACGKAILASLDGEGARIIQEAQAGITVPAENPKELADAVLRLNELGQEQLKVMGQNARKYYEKHFSRKHLLDLFERWLDELSADSD